MFGNCVKGDLCAIANLSNGVKSLATLGAKNIMVVNLPDLGNLPATRQDPQVSKFLSDLTQKHNSGLAESLLALSQSLGNRVNIIQFDVYSLFSQVLASPQKFGFTIVTDAELEQLSKFKGYTDEFFFWDDIHPTTAVHKLLAKYALEVLTATNKLYLLVENRDGSGTYFKQSTSQSSTLPFCQKYSVNNGSKWEILSYKEAENQHYLVNFKNKIGNLGCETFNSWYVYRPHVSF